MYASLELTLSEQQGEGTILGLECLEEGNEERSTPSQVYKKLLLVLKTLHSHLLGKTRRKMVIRETEVFEEALKNMEYLQDDSTDLLKYARDVNCHFASKKCRDVIVAARKLMTSKMHNTVKGEPAEVSSPCRRAAQQLHVPGTPPAHPGAPFQSPPATAPQRGCRNVCRHGAWIQETGSLLGFLGAQCFLAQLNVQRAELIERLSTAHNFCNLDDEDNYIAASKAVRQVIHQLKQLGTVWQDVLPVSIYCKAMGNLLNTAITEIIAKIMMLEDISSEDGEHLHTLCQTIIEEGPLVFIPLAEENKNKKYQEEVPLYVKKWSTFKELVIVLRANLQEIVDSASSRQVRPESSGWAKRPSRAPALVAGLGDDWRKYHLHHVLHSEPLGATGRFTITPQRHYPLQQMGVSSVGVLPPVKWDGFRKKNVLSPRNSPAALSPVTVKIARPEHKNPRSHIMIIHL
ncbi:hypothetical protein XENOCAPTIV_007838 [Xenoophorus captivus]|uniref:Uncharacterized protein n=1 Tax=Xenoophorus captivus TaxID=1517983 RepID=A0ABV0QH25_9TELE